MNDVEIIIDGKSMIIPRKCVENGMLLIPRNYDYAFNPVPKGYYYRPYPSFKIQELSLWIK